MAKTATVVVEYVGRVAAKVWRRADEECPHGRSYMVGLDSIVVTDIDEDVIRAGDVLEVRIDENDEVESARILKHDESLGRTLALA